MAEEFKIINSSNGNYYLICEGIPQILIIHPYIAYVKSIEQKKENTSLLFSNNTALKIIDSTKKLNSDYLGYYHSYIDFLKRHSYFVPSTKNPMKLNRYTGEIVKRLLSNTQEIVFEITTQCNMDCVYCGYGRLYLESENRKAKELSIEKAKNIIDYILKLGNSNINQKSFKNRIIGFYGGEPLLNFKFISELVEYTENLNLSSNKFSFRITTNGILLNNYVDYLVEKDFQLVISIDGDEQHNVFRLLKDGRSSYPFVIKNIFELRRRYPTYFKKNVKFNSVIHSENSIDEIKAFFNKKFEKDTRIIELSKIGVKPSMEHELLKIYKNVSKKHNKKGDEISGFILSKIKLFRAINTNSYYIASRYKKWLEETHNSFSVLTGTCPPFKKKIFCTAEGKILPCERIPRYYNLGEVGEKEVNINFQEIADKYNQWYEKVKNQCNKCKDSQYCGNCIFYLDLESNNTVCSKFKNIETYINELNMIISMLEKYPHIYLNILNNNDRKKSPINDNDSLYWLYLHPYTHLNIKKDCAIIYNTLNGSLLEYKGKNEILCILKRINSNQNLYVIGLNKKNLTLPIKNLIKDIRSTFSGDIYESSFSDRKPFQFKPLHFLDIAKNKITFKSKVKLLEGDELSSYLDKVNLYINNSCDQKCLKCDQAFKQFLCCRSENSNKKELDIKTIEKLIEDFENISISQLNILGGNILKYSKFEDLTIKLNQSTFAIGYYIHYLNILAIMDNDWIIKIFKGRKNSLNIIIDFPIKSELLLKIDHLKKNGLKVLFHFIIESEKDIEELEKIKIKLNDDEIIIIPFYNKNNYNFFKQYVFITKEALKESCPSMRDIFVQLTINSLEFTKLTIFNNGNIYANVNNAPIGRLDKNSIIVAVKNEMIKGRSWGKIRKNVYPCKTCAYYAICPPISNYEYVLKQYNCCNITPINNYKHEKNLGE